MKVMVNIQSCISTSFDVLLHSSVKKMQGWGFVHLPSLSYHTYLVCILFGMQSLHLFYIFNVFISV